MGERELGDRVRPHRGAGQHGAVDAAVVEHGEQVGGQALVAVVARVARGRGAAVGAGVVGDHAMAGALERARAHHHVAPRRGQPVQQHDRAPLPRLLAGQHHAVRVDPEIHGHYPRRGAHRRH
jgi:hypothetical protein